MLAGSLDEMTCQVFHLSQAECGNARNRISLYDYLPAFVAVGQEAEARESPAGEGLPRVGMLGTLRRRDKNKAAVSAGGEEAASSSGPRGAAHLYSRQDAVDDLDGAAVGVSGQRLRDAVNLHLAFWLRARLFAVDGLTRGALKAAVLRTRKAASAFELIRATPRSEESDLTIGGTFGINHFRVPGRRVGFHTRF